MQDFAQFAKNPEVEYTMDRVVLEAIDQEKDLGVYITNNCMQAQCTMLQGSPESDEQPQSY